MSDFKIDEVANIVRDAGGRVVGRTRLQKIAYLMAATGLDNNFRFSYKHYGPFSEQLASSAKLSSLLGAISERKDNTAWGGTYSTYTVENSDQYLPNASRRQLASIAAAADSIELELAATAVFLFNENYPDPWAETANRKPEKSTDYRLNNAKQLLRDLYAVEVPNPLPAVLVG